ncbi:SMI1/KNR4 family protein [Myxococcaceae bacterium JPH2]|nr:SMI1/KNR4 family protein [Myxococcaceae bacterium JPH2]
MVSAMEAIEELWARLARETDLPIKVLELTPVDGTALRELERTLGELLPASYLRFVAQHGLLRVTDRAGIEQARMLSPSEVLEFHEGFKTFVEEDSFGDEEDEREAALLELEVRRRLVPFQYIADPYVNNFYSFDTGLRQPSGPLIIQAYHDDYDLASWLLSDAPDTSSCTFDFDEHLRWVLKACAGEGKWGR